MLTCQREMAEKAKGVFVACRAKAGSPMSGPIYVATLGAKEAGNGASEALRVAENEARRRGLCKAG
jgi:putative N-acetylmannosamine-6-phosphate epimerase